MSFAQVTTAAEMLADVAYGHIHPREMDGESSVLQQLARKP
jgi:hypothetical protein